jgi:hypothetical protein
VLATFALLYGGWHIFRQNFGFLRELAGRSGLGRDRRLRLLDHAASATPAIALWLLISARGPWHFITADIYHHDLPASLVGLGYVAVAATAALRLWRAPSPAAALLLAGNAAALLGPALLLDDLTMIYTLAASFHGFQYLAYVVERERERSPDEDRTAVILPLLSTIILSTGAMLAALAIVGWLCSPAVAMQGLLIAWYAIVPFHYFVDGKIWRKPSISARSPSSAVRCM